MKIIVKGKEYDLENIHITGNKTEEREVTVTTTADENIIHVYTSDDTYLTKLKKCISSNPKDWKIVDIIFKKDDAVSGVMIEGPKNGLSFRAGNPREYTEEQLTNIKDRLASVRRK